MKQRFASTIIIILSAASTLVSQDQSVDFMRSVGKIYVVVAVLCIIFILMIGYLIYLDRKMTKLEKKIEHERK